MQDVGVQPEPARGSSRPWVLQQRGPLFVPSYPFGAHLTTAPAHEETVVVSRHIEIPLELTPLALTMFAIDHTQKAPRRWDVDFTVLDESANAGSRRLGVTTV
jgi:hypothetical protein